MLCTNPQTFQKNGVFVPCGGCQSCRINRQKEWFTKLMLEAKTFKNPLFITLTYSPENLPDHSTLVKKHLQDFFKRLRSHITYNTPNHKIRYFGVGEYGTKTLRPHYHAIIYNIDVIVAEKLIKKSWTLGHSQVGLVRKGGMRYVTGYTLKKLTSQNDDFFKKHPELLPEFSLMSRKPALGSYAIPAIGDRLIEHGLYPNAVLTPEMKLYARDRGLQYKNFNGVIKVNGISGKLDMAMLHKLAEYVAPGYQDWLTSDSYIVPPELKAYKLRRHSQSFNDTMDFMQGEDFEKTTNKAAKRHRQSSETRLL